MRVLAILLALLLAAPALAQDIDDDDGGRGFLTGAIENALSGAGRDVRITGFEGALSSTATLDRLEISDSEGVWLTVEDARLTWSRRALLRGRLEVEELIAGAIIVERAPVSEPAAPDAAASQFRIPELPVSVDIGLIAAERVELGEGFLGERLAFEVSGRAALADGGLDTAITARRIDGTPGQFAIALGFDPDDDVLSVDLSLTEDAGGIAATLLDLPGAPSVALLIEGQGPLDDFRARIDLDTDGQDRIGGTVALLAEEAGADGPTRRFELDLDGDVTALALPQYREFFGTEIGLRVAGAREPSGRIEIETLDLDAAALRLTGSATIAPDNLPDAFDLQVVLGSPDGPVALPGGGGIEVGAADLRATFDASDGDSWTLAGRIDGLDTAQADIGAIQIDGGGEIARDALAAGEGRTVTARLRLETDGLALEDPAIAEAVGDDPAVLLDIAWEEGAPVTIRRAALEGDGYGLDISGRFDLASSEAEDGTIIEAGLTLDGEAAFEDLSRLAALAGADLSGAARLELAGRIALGGAFDLALTAQATDLGIGIAAVDDLIGGEATIALDAARDLDGTVIRAASVETGALSAEVSGTIGEDAAQIALVAALTDISPLVPQLSGPVTLDGNARMTQGRWTLGLEAAAPAGTTATVFVVAPPGGPLAVDFEADIARLGEIVPQLEGAATATGRAVQAEDGWRVTLDAQAPQGLTADIDARVITDGPIEAAYTAAIADIGAFTEALDGPATLQGTARIEDGETRIEAEVQAPRGISATASARLAGEAPPVIAYDARIADIGAFTGLVTGAARLSGTATRDGEAWITDARLAAPAGTALRARVRLDGADVAADLTGRIEAPSEIVDGLPGPLDIRAEVARTDGTIAADVVIDAPGGDALTFAATLPPEGAAAARFDLRVARPDQFLNGLPGPLTANGDVTRDADGAITIDASASAADGSALTVDGAFPAGLVGGEARFDAVLADLGRFVPQLPGRTEAAGTVRRTEAGWAVDADATAPAGIRATVSAAQGPDGIAAEFDAGIGDVSVFVPQLAGAATARGTAAQVEGGYRLDVAATGPGGLTADIAGTYGASSDLSITGSAPLALANPFVRPRSLSGTARFDLSLDGPAEIASLSGTVSVADARIAIPRQRFSIEGLGGTVRLGGGTATLDLRGAGSNGGTLAVAGSIGLSPPNAADLRLTAAGLVLRDPILYETSIDAAIAITGPVVGGGGRIAGEVRLGETEVRIGDAPVGGTGAIPIIDHRRSPPEVTATRQRARLTATEVANRDGTPRRNQGFALDLTVLAERRIFVRGRGLDAELGGTLSLTGFTSNVIPAGRFELIRGRLDILGRRLTLTEGTIALQGDFVPTVRLVATTDTDSGQVSIVVDGPISEPEITFESEAGLPQDEVIAQLLFGQDLGSLTPLQAARLASAVATLTGRGGSGFFGDLRENFGLDDLDLTSRDDGTVALRAGRYLTENIYSDVTIDAEGQAEINLNLDVTDNLTARGRLAADGETGIGIFYERDY